VPLINTKDYPIAGLWFNGIGCLFWVVAYIVLVREIRRKKYVEMPAYVAGANIGWELVWSIFNHPDTGLLYAASYVCAFLLDCYIFVSVLRYGTRQPVPEGMKKKFHFFCGVNFIFWILFSYLYHREGYDTTIGANSGYIINVIVSVQCLAMLMSTTDISNFSRLLGWSKLLGTGLISVSMFIFYPQNHLVQLLGIACFLTDVTYIVTLIRRHGSWL
jgi:hypothetical protein